MNALQLKLSLVLLKIFLRDRQAIFFSMFFPIIFLSVLGLASGQLLDPTEIGVVNYSNSQPANEFIELMREIELLDVTVGEEETLKKKLLNGDTTMVLIIPDNFQTTDNTTELPVFVDASQVRRLGLIIPILETALLSVERKILNNKPMFSIAIKDVQARSQRYIDFLLPGILAFTLMQICITGSGFNLVEYRRKGILKRLFVTPIRPRDFIAGICIARMWLCLLQLSVLLAVAIFALDVIVVGSLISLYLVIIMGTIIFLCLGFCVGSLAHTQQGVSAVGNIVIFPQIILSGVFFPISSMPEMIQPIANLLPLSFVATSMREITNNGSGLIDFLPVLGGVFAWIVLSFMLATRLFVWKEVVR